MAATKDLQLGSGKLYVKKVTDETTIPSLKALCIEDNQIGWIKGGATVSYAPTTYDIKDDMGAVNEHFIIGEDVSIKSGLLTWNKDVITALINNETVSEDGAVLIGAQGFTRMDKYIVIFEATPTNDGIQRRFGMIATSDKGLELSYAPERETVIDVEWKATSDADGHLLRIEEETISA